MTNMIEMMISETLAQFVAASAADWLNGKTWQHEIHNDGSESLEGMLALDLGEKR